MEVGAKQCPISSEMFEVNCRRPPYGDCILAGERKGEEPRDARLLVSLAESGAAWPRETRAAASRVPILGGGDAQTREPGSPSGRKTGDRAGVGGQRAPGHRNSSKLIDVARLTAVRVEHTEGACEQPERTARGEAECEGMQLREPPPPPRRPETSTMGSCCRIIGTSVGRHLPGLEASTVPFSASATCTTEGGLSMRATRITGGGLNLGVGERSCELALLTADSDFPQGGNEFGERWPHSINS